MTTYLFVIKPNIMYSAIAHDKDSEKIIKFIVSVHEITISLFHLITCT